MIKAIIFDLDGTIAYTLPDILCGINLMLDEFNIERIDKAHLLRAINYGSRHLVKMCLPEILRGDDDFVDNALNIYKNYYSLHCTDECSLYDEVDELLNSIRKLKIKTAVLSNKDDIHTKAVVNKLAPEKFDIVLGFDGKFPHKPDPTSAHYIMDKFGVSKEEMIYVGDSPIDVQTGKNSGFFTIAAAWGFSAENILKEENPDCILQKPSQILEYIK